MFEWKKNLGWLLALFLIGFFIFAFNLNNQLFWDDDDWIINNPNVHSLSWDNVKTIFTTDILSGFGLSSDYYRPLLLLSFAFNWVLHGAEPFGYHLISNLFHISNALLVFSILYLVLKKQSVAFMVALLWLAHPLNVEAVAYISGRGDPMSVFFILLGLLFFIESQSLIPNTKYLILSAVAMVFAILSRETAVLFPALAMILYISFISKRKFWYSVVGAIKATIPFWVVSAVYFILRLTILNFQNTLNFYNEANIYTENLSYRLFTFSHALVEYFKLLFIPTGLHMERDLLVATSLFQWPVWLGVLIVLGILYVGYKLYKKSLNTNYSLLTTDYRVWFFGWSWFFIGLAPVSGVIPINALIYEHWLYLPMIGFWIIVAFYLIKLFDYLKLHNKKILLGSCVLVLVSYISFFGIQSIKRNVLWGDPIKFYEDILRYNPDSVRVINNLANAYSDKGDLDGAEELYRQIIESESGKLFAQPYYNLGNIYRDKGDLERAEELYKQAIGIDPSFSFAYRNLAALYANAGLINEAIAVLKELKLIRPDLEIDATIEYLQGF